VLRAAGADGEAHGKDGEGGSGSPGGRKHKHKHSMSHEGKKHHGHSPSSKSGLKKRHLKYHDAVKELNLRQVGWTMGHVFDDKLKRDALDELEPSRALRPLPLFTVLPFTPSCL
jgi:hypothetical protein